MTNKFTEEQYNKIQDIDFIALGPEQNYDVLAVIIDARIKPSREQMNMALAIANPLTREWAHDKFVEKEKKYYWKLNELYLERDMSDGSILFNETRSSLTESEIREWGFNPDMFDKEEV